MLENIPLYLGPCASLTGKINRDFFKDLITKIEKNVFFHC